MGYYGITQVKKHPLPHFSSLTPVDNSGGKSPFTPPNMAATGGFIIVFP
jgi:hypothetical protein